MTAGRPDRVADLYREQSGSVGGDRSGHELKMQIEASADSRQRLDRRVTDPPFDAADLALSDTAPRREISLRQADASEADDYLR